jgi:hypothetical protein
MLYAFSVASQRFAIMLGRDQEEVAALLVVHQCQVKTRQAQDPVHDEGVTEADLRKNDLPIMVELGAVDHANTRRICPVVHQSEVVDNER